MTNREPQLDTRKIDDAVLALLLLGLHRTKDVARAWKSHDWDSLSRLREAGYIFDPVSKSQSVVFTQEGLERGEKLLHNLFGAIATDSIEPENAKGKQL